jgi:hypothetical protein
VQALPISKKRYDIPDRMCIERQVLDRLQLLVDPVTSKSSREHVIMFDPTEGYPLRTVFPLDMTKVFKLVNDILNGHSVKVRIELNEVISITLTRENVDMFSHVFYDLAAISIVGAIMSARHGRPMKLGIVLYTDTFISEPHIGPLNMISSRKPLKPPQIRVLNTHKTTYAPSDVLLLQYETHGSIPKPPHPAPTPDSGSEATSGT